MSFNLPAPSLGEMQLALSHIVSAWEYRPLAAPSQLKLLNLIALLLTDGKGDAPAVALRRLSRGRLELHYAKNRPCTMKEKEYICRLFEVITREDRREDHKLCRDILALVIPECEGKIKSRKEKVCSRLRQLASAFGICGDACTRETDTALRGLFEESGFPTAATLPQLLHLWFTHLLKPDTWHVDSVHQTLRLAYLFGLVPGMNHILDRQLLLRVRKLGDYYGAALALINDTGLLPLAQLRQLRIVEAISPASELRLLRTNPVEVVNAWAHHVGEAGVSEADLRLAFPEITAIPSTPSAMHEFCVHSECTLLMAMIAINAAMPMRLEIGLSKPSCAMCCAFIAAMKKQYYRHITVTVWANRGKHVAGWRLPEAAPRRVREAIEKHVVNEMHNVLQCAAWMRKFGSISRESAPE